MKFPENDEAQFLFADFILRFQAAPQQFIPSWTGFYIKIHEGQVISKSSVQYLDCIDSPATEKSTIYQVR